MTDRPPLQQGLAASLTGVDTSLVDVIDSLVDKGVVLQGDVALGIAGIDLITLKLAALLVSAERLGTSSTAPREGGTSDGSQRGAAMPAPLPAEPAPRSPGLPFGRNAGGGSAAAHASIAAGTRSAPATGAVPPGDASSGGVRLGRWDVDPDDVRRSVMRLVLTLVEVIRQLLERRAIRQMESDHLSDVEVERLGRSLHELEQTVLDLAAGAGLDPAELNLDLGPLGRLL